MIPLSDCFDQLPISIAELARRAHVHEKTIRRMRDGEPVHKDTANRVLAALSTIYHEELTLDTVSGVVLEGEK